MRKGTAGFVPLRLTEAREVRGITQTSLAMLVGVTPPSVSQYERGLTTPSPEILREIADKLEFPEVFFVTPHAEYTEGATFFRSRASNPKVVQRAAGWRLKWLVDIVHYLSTYLELPTYNLSAGKEVDPRRITQDHIEAEAVRMRREWGLGDGAISDVTLLLENTGLIVSRYTLFEEREDGFSRRLLDGTRDYIVLNADHNCAVRSRFDLAHELGHLVLHRHLSENDRLAHHDLLEKQAHAFAGAFLLPRTSFPRDFTVPSLEVLSRIKRKWKVSIAAMLMRSKALDLIDDEALALQMRRLRYRGWHKSEPLDEQLEPEVPRLLRRSFKVLEESGLQTRADMLAALPYSPADLESIASLPPGFFNPDARMLSMPEVSVRDKPSQSGTAKFYRLSEART